jgi:hypothetical protein
LRVSDVDGRKAERLVRLYGFFGLMCCGL